MGWYENSLFGPIAADVAAIAPDGAVVLEVGCGSGPLSVRLATDHGLSVTAFDIDPERIGGHIEGVPIHHFDDLPAIAQANAIRLAILAVPATAAQSVVDRLRVAGIEGILNFAPVTLALPPGMRQVGVDLAIELEQLSFSVVNRI